MYLDSQGRDEDRHRAQNDFTLYPSQGCFEIMNLMPFLFIKHRGSSTINHYVLASNKASCIAR